MLFRQLSLPVPATNPSWFVSIQYRHGYQREHHISAWDAEVHSNQGHNSGQYPFGTDSRLLSLCLIRKQTFSYVSTEQQIISVHLQIARSCWWMFPHAFCLLLHAVGSWLFSFTTLLRSFPCHQRSHPENQFAQEAGLSDSRRGDWRLHHTPVALHFPLIHSDQTLPPCFMLSCFSHSP